MSSMLAQNIFGRRKFLRRCLALLFVPVLSACKRNSVAENKQPADMPVSLGKIADLHEGINPFTIYRVAVERQGQSFRAISLGCTHQTCLINLRPDGEGFDCPCHGSRFAKDGSVQVGPARRPLPFFRLSAEAGELILHAGDTVESSWALQIL